MTSLPRKRTSTEIVSYGQGHRVSEAGLEAELARSSCLYGTPCMLLGRSRYRLPRAAQHATGMEVASSLETSSCLSWSLPDCRILVPKVEKNRSLSLWRRASEGPELLCQPQPSYMWSLGQRLALSAATSGFFRPWGLPWSAGS